MGKNVAHVECPAQDVDRAEQFWEAVVGWSIGLFQSDESVTMPEAA